MKCEDVRNNISAFLDNELPVMVYHDVMRHLEQCPHCMAEKERLDGTISLINTMEIPVLKSDIFDYVSSSIVCYNSVKSYNIFTGMLGMVGVLTAGFAFMVLLSPFGQAIIGLVRAFSRNFMELGSMLYKITARGSLGAQGWLPLTLFLAFLFTVWLLRRLSLKSDWGGPIHE